MKPQDLPEPIRGNESGSWAETTVKERLPGILDRIREENSFPDRINRNLELLRAEIPHENIRPVEEVHAPDFSSWEEYTAPYLEMNWLQVPWFFSETYFYRRIMQAVAYFSGGGDPFQRQKRLGYQKSRPQIISFVERLDRWVEKGETNESVLRQLLYLVLWGNQADLSLWPAGGENSPDHQNLATAAEHLLADDSSRIIQLLQGLEPQTARLDIILDNAGFELITDLGLADMALSNRLAGEIILHVKAHPTFVSDVIEDDLTDTLFNLKGDKHPRIREFGSRLQNHLAARRLVIRGDFFWNSPLALWEMPERLLEAFAGTSLVFTKGDANYRRITGDRHWPFSTPFGEVLDYLPVPLAALRTLKAELAVGLREKEITRARQQDPEWMIDGRWGVVQYTPGNRERVQ
ncbi:MAG: damage-control phosphatase ARMT1 family protein [Anaerolineales bacterium]|nr:damage-control phosphatase ARMT1 family protein [Anaerolineales bacterium]